MHFVQQILQSLALAKKKKKIQKGKNKRFFLSVFRFTAWPKYYPVYDENYYAEHSVLIKEEY